MFSKILPTCNATPFLRSKNGLLLGHVAGGHLPVNTVPRLVSNSMLGGGIMGAGMLGGMMGGMLGGMMPGAAGPMLPVPGLASNSGGMRPVFGFVHTRH